MLFSSDHEQWSETLLPDYIYLWYLCTYLFQCQLCPLHKITFLLREYLYSLKYSHTAIISPLLCHAEQGMFFLPPLLNSASWIPFVVLESHTHPHLKTTSSGTRIEQQRWSNMVWLVHWKRPKLLLLSSIRALKKWLRSSNRDVTETLTAQRRQMGHFTPIPQNPLRMGHGLYFWYEGTDLKQQKESVGSLLQDATATRKTNQMQEKVFKKKLTFQFVTFSH